MKLQSVMTAQGCTGDKMEFDDGGYGVDDAQCSDDEITVSVSTQVSI